MIYGIVGLGVFGFVVCWLLYKRMNDIHVCSRMNRTERVRKLLEKNRNLVNLQFGDGETPVHQAAKYGAIETLGLLLDRGGEVNAETAEGATPLHFAAAFGEMESVRLLLKRGAAADPKERTGITPIMAARMGEHAEIVRVLKEAGADDTAVPAVVYQEGGRFVTPIEADDPLMAKAIQQARATIPEMLRLFALYPERTMVKVPLEAGPGGEKVWAEVLRVEGARISVKIKSVPLSRSSASPSKRDLDLDGIEDWQVELPNGQIRGGYGYQVLFVRTREKLGKLPDEMALMEPRFVDHGTAPGNS